MAKGEVSKAANRYDERKQAISGKLKDSPSDCLESMDQIRMLLHDTDLDLNELLHIGGEVSAVAAHALATGAPPFEVLKGVWVDGLVVGLYIAKAREGK